MTSHAVRSPLRAITNRSNINQPEKLVKHTNVEPSSRGDLQRMKGEVAVVRRPAGDAASPERFAMCPTTILDPALRNEMSRFSGSASALLDYLLRSGRFTNDDAASLVRKWCRQRGRYEDRVAKDGMKMVADPDVRDEIYDMLNSFRGLEGKFRVLDKIGEVRLPFYEHDNVQDFINEIKIDEVRDYLRSLLNALSYIHESGIVHRDVKPTNFLWNRKTRSGVLVDFGLAEVCHAEPIALHRSAHSARNRNTSKPYARNGQQLRRKPGTGKESSIAKENEPKGFYINDHRQAVRANRAGTRGFRAPEVLMKCPNQTTAIDVWAVGVTMLSFLTRSYPFFSSQQGDTEALLEISHIFGKEAMVDTARHINRSFVTNIPEVAEGTPLKDIVARMHSINDIPESAHQLLAATMTLRPDLRITAADALKHEFFN
ncbi:hypothetical protein HK101_009770 [Irineochytrium annulatum]|nr:hypothetical protein HK101_009770 [Irineochytrium annulatum]